MAIEFCPLADEVGKLSEWFAVGVGVIAAASTTYVAFLAYRTSARAADIAEEAKGIAQQQHNEAVASREANARIITRLLLHEISELPQNIFTQILRAKRKEPGPSGAPNIGSFARALTAASSSFLPGAEQMQDRIHNLRDDIGDDLATLIGYSRTLGQMSRDFLPAVKVRAPRSIHEAAETIYTGNLRDIEIFTEYLEMYLELSIEFANRFRQHGGIPAYDYSDLHVRDA